MKDKIAIVGIGCRYPQAENVAGLWRLLRKCENAISTYPGGRFTELDSFYTSPKSYLSNKIDVARGGFLPSVDQFDS
jgi:acyl transferase domain-containing protein